MIFGEYHSPGLETFILYIRERRAHTQGLVRIIIPPEWFAPLEAELNRININRTAKGKSCCFFTNRDCCLDGYANFYIKGIPICCDDSDIGYMEEYK